MINFCLDYSEILLVDIYAFLQCGRAFNVIDAYGITCCKVLIFVFLVFQDAGPMAHPVRPHSYIKVRKLFVIKL